MLISMKLVKTEDGTGEYWSPFDWKGRHDKEAIRLIDDLGHPPDTDSWIERPDIPGWYDHEVIGRIVVDATACGHSIGFNLPEEPFIDEIRT
jgi:hypothetical protein